MITVDGVKQNFGESFSLDVSLEVLKKEYLVLLGPSGCGKSLLLGAIAGIVGIAEGAIAVDGRDVSDEPPERREIGYVFQQRALFPHLSVIGNIEFSLRIRKLSPAQRKERVDELVQTLDLAPLLDRPVPTLSGGESQKVAIARALAPKPQILLLDEPLSLVDHNSRLELQDELKRIHQDLGITTLHVTHNREEAQALADRCAVMLGGRIVQLGKRIEVFSRPNCIFVDRFLGVGSETPPPAPGCSEICLAGNGQCDRPYSSEQVASEKTQGDEPAEKA